MLNVSTAAGAAAGERRSEQLPKPSKPKRRRSQVADEHQASADEKAAALAASMPDTRAELLSLARASVEEINSAVLCADVPAAVVAADRYNAVIWKLNGGTYFGSRGDEDAAGYVVARHCRGVPGLVPMWGQIGEFVATVEGIRVLVEFGEGFGSALDCHFSFNVVDFDCPFISETGYRSHFELAHRGRTVDQAAIAILKDMLKGYRPRVSEDAQARLVDRPLPEWFAKQHAAARRVLAVAASPTKAETLPPGFVLVDVVLTAHQAFIARRWEAAAQLRMRHGEQTQNNARTLNVSAAKAERCSSTSTSAAKVLPPLDCVHDFQKGTRCMIEQVHHECFADRIGKVVIVTGVDLATETVWAQDDKPKTFRKNRNGRLVVASDPSCIQTAYSMSSLSIVS